MQANGRLRIHMVKEIQAGWGVWEKTTGVMRGRMVPGNVKRRPYKTIVRSALLYGIDVVAVTKAQKCRLQR